MKALVKSTGEEIEFNPKTPSEIQQVWQLCSEYIKAYESIKDKLKPLVAPLIQSNGTSEPLNGFVFRQMSIQRMNYDKSLMRELLDEDTFDVLLEPAKTKVDNYLKENIEQLGEKGSLLRQNMIAVGKPYSVTKLEKL